MLVFARVRNRTTRAMIAVTMLLTHRIFPALQAHARRFRIPRESCLDLHPSDAAPDELRWRQNFRDLVLELGFAPDPGEWIFCRDRENQWAWEYTVRSEALSRSSSSFAALEQCLKDAKEHGFSSSFAIYSSRCDTQETTSPELVGSIAAHSNRTRDIRMASSSGKDAEVSK